MRTDSSSSGYLSQEPGQGASRRRTSGAARSLDRMTSLGRKPSSRSRPVRDRYHLPGVGTALPGVSRWSSRAAVRRALTVRDDGLFELRSPESAAGHPVPVPPGRRALPARPGVPTPARGRPRHLGRCRRRRRSRGPIRPSAGTSSPTWCSTSCTWAPSRRPGPSRRSSRTCPSWSSSGSPPSS